MPSKVVGYSGKYLKQSCKNCNAKKMEIVQVQSYLGLGNFRLIGVGPRKLKKVCTECDNFEDLTEDQETKAKKLKYTNDEGSSGETLLGPSSSTRAYPVLDEERRKEIRANNMKEGFLSLIIGTIIGFFILLIPNTIAFWVGLVLVIYSILGGLYAAFEDPERKHRDWLNNKKSLIN